MADYSKLAQAIGDLDEALVLGLVKQIAVDPGADAEAAVAACQQGLTIVGDRFETGEYYVADLIFAGDLMTEAFAMLKPLMAGKANAGLGKMVLATVEGDLHDIGKNIVRVMLESAGFEVLDLGIDVGTDTILRSVRESGARILGLSGLLTVAIDAMKRTVDALESAGLRQQVKVIIGGAPITAEYCRMVGADAWSASAVQGVRTCRQWALEPGERGA